MGTPTPPRWCSTGALCHELGWSRSRLLHELRSGLLPYRTFPTRITIDWHRPEVARSLDVEASEVRITRGVESASGEVCFVLGFDRLTVGIEVLPPTDDEAAPSLAVPSAPPAPSPEPLPEPPASPKQVSEAALERCIQAIVVERTERGLPPLTQGKLHEEVERRLGAQVARDRVRDVRDEVAPQFRRPVGKPRKGM